LYYKGAFFVSTCRNSLMCSPSFNCTFYDLANLLRNHLVNRQHQFLIIIEWVVTSSLSYDRENNFLLQGSNISLFSANISSHLSDSSLIESGRHLRLANGFSKWYNTRRLVFLYWNIGTKESKRSEDVHTIM